MYLNMIATRATGKQKTGWSGCGEGREAGLARGRKKILQADGAHSDRQEWVSLEHVQKITCGSWHSNLISPRTVAAARWNGVGVTNQ